MSNIKIFCNTKAIKIDYWGRMETRKIDLSIFKNFKFNSFGIIGGKTNLPFSKLNSRWIKGLNLKKIQPSELWKY